MTTATDKIPPARYALLQQFGAFYAGFWAAVRDTVEHMTDEEMVEVEAGMAQLTQTNCWFAIWGAREAVLTEIKSVRYARELARERAEEAST